MHFYYLNVLKNINIFTLKPKNFNFTFTLIVWKWVLILYGEKCYNPEIVIRKIVNYNGKNAKTLYSKKYIVIFIKIKNVIIPFIIYCVYKKTIE